MLTRRGQLGWIFMCVVVIALVIASFFIFVSFENKSEDYSQSFALVARESLYAQHYSEKTLRFMVARAISEVPTLFLRDDYARVNPHRGLRESFTFIFEKRLAELASEYDSGDSRYGTFFKDVGERHAYTLTEMNGVYTLTMPHIEQTTRQGNHIITRSFSLEVRFNRDGLL